MAKTGSQIVAASEKRRGIQSTSFKFTPEEKELLDRLADQHGGKKDAIIAGLKALERRNGPTKQEVIAAIKANWED
jgi:hypothetical protein